MTATGLRHLSISDSGICLPIVPKVPETHSRRVIAQVGHPPGSVRQPPMGHRANCPPTSWASPGSRDPARLLRARRERDQSAGEVARPRAAERPSSSIRLGLLSLRGC